MTTHTSKFTPETNPILTLLDVHVLIALSKSPMHGYGISQQIIADFGSNQCTVKPSAVYKVLRRLQDYGYVQQSDTIPGSASPFKRKLFELTIAGTSVLELTCNNQSNLAQLGIHRLKFNRATAKY